MSKEDNITFTINQVAKILGVVPATIRNWEKTGLIAVKRSTNNYRVFSPEDIENLRRIKEYSVEKRMGANAIKMLAPISTESVVENFVEQQKEVFYSRKLMSEKWREIRKQLGYTLEDVSREVGISVAHLSNLENGSNVSLDLLNKLAHFYKESPLYFMAPSNQESHIVKKGEGEPILLKSEPGLTMTSLIAMNDHIMYPVLCSVEPGCGNLNPHTHNGEELIYMLSGVIEIKLNEDPPYVIRTGDTFYYQGSDLHSWQNISSKTAKLLWIHSSVSKKSLPVMTSYTKDQTSD